MCVRVMQEQYKYLYHLAACHLSSGKQRGSVAADDAPIYANSSQLWTIAFVLYSALTSVQFTQDDGHESRRLKQKQFPNSFETVSKLFRFSQKLNARAVTVSFLCADSLIRSIENMCSAPSLCCSIHHRLFVVPYARQCAVECSFCFSLSR